MEEDDTRIQRRVRILECEAKCLLLGIVDP
jgi:hypothetical protein